MKPLRAALLLGCVAVAAGCVRRREPPPPPGQIERPAPPPVRAAPPPPANWQDLPLTPGRWFYRNEGQNSLALFGPADSSPTFTVRCDRARRQVILSREGISTGNMMIVRTSYSARSLPLSVQTEPLNSAFANLPASDRFLDGMAFSRGRFTVEVPGTPMLVIPAWPEPARVVEDCRS
ncbi:MAG: hypothetical protein M3N39_00425 [Pseudomonadota bacterium]|nr:hypothetical protein [Pseudomonadota bacterium]